MSMNSVEMPLYVKECGLQDLGNLITPYWQISRRKPTGCFMDLINYSII